MPSMTALATITPQRPAITHIVGIGLKRLDGNLFDWFADQGIDPADAPVEPRSAAQTADDRDRHGLCHGRTRDGARVTEIEQRGARGLQLLRSLDQLLGRALVAVKFGEHRDALL